MGGRLVADGELVLAAGYSPVLAELVDAALHGGRRGAGDGSAGP